MLRVIPLGYQSNIGGIDALDISLMREEVPA
jgi:hypothetical protein